MAGITETETLLFYFHINLRVSAKVEDLGIGAASLTESGSDRHTHHECPYGSKCRDRQLNRRK